MQLQINTQPRTQHLQQIKKNLQEKKKYILDVIGNYIVYSVNLNFENQGRPEKWKENAPSTKARKKRNLILQESLVMRMGITYEVDENLNEVSIVPSWLALKYSFIHNFGGKAGINRSVVIPARPYLLIHESDHEWINKFVRNEVFYAPA